MRSTAEILRDAAALRPALSRLTTEKKNAALLAVADALVAETENILAANALDVEAAQGKISPVMIDRLRLTADRIGGMAQGIREVAALPDPVGVVVEDFTRPNGMRVRKRLSPMGVIAIIYESRPNVTSDAAALCLKAGSVCVLRGGKEAHRSAAAVVDAIHAGLRQTGLPEGMVSLVEDTSRASAGELMHAEGLVDLLIPRGGAGLIRACVE
jgi:glutamate-5-semialdehyde dehydrogenase